MIVVWRHTVYECDKAPNYWLQIMSVGSCKYNEHWEVDFEGTSKNVSHFYGICVSVYGGVDNSELIIIIIIYSNPQLPVSAISVIIDFFDCLEADLSR